MSCHNESVTYYSFYIKKLIVSCLTSPYLIGMLVLRRITNEIGLLSCSGISLHNPLLYLFADKKTVLNTLAYKVLILKDYFQFLVLMGKKSNVKMMFFLSQRKLS